MRTTIVRSGLVAVATLALAFPAPRPAAAQVGENLALLEPNLASRDELLEIPYLDEDLVSVVVEGRPYLDMLSLDRVLGGRLTEDQREAVYRRLWTPLNLNQATEEEILLIPGVGDRMLHEFEEYRPYRALAEFHREIGKYVDDDELARLAQYVFVPIDLNTASDEEILSIPGVGERMLHEFEEYRPYRALAEFHREIGKYVDDDELARLARYVTIR